MSKLGIIALTRLLARDFPKMRVNSVDPGYCATDQNQMQGNRPAERGAVTPYLLATTNEIFSGMHWFDEKEMQWSY
jgi:NAD(P)-dependent dehydrogenase (short-subunit alcohol dehydrogenase family)